MSSYIEYRLVEIKDPAKGFKESHAYKLKADGNWWTSRDVPFAEWKRHATGERWIPTASFTCRLPDGLQPGDACKELRRLRDEVAR